MGSPNVPELLGGAQIVNIILNATSGSAFQFSGSWFADQRETQPITITAVDSKVMRGDDPVLDIGFYTTFSGNDFIVNVPSSVIGDLDAGWVDECRWYFELSSSGREALSMSGTARIR